jgi:hypothetical protein
MRPPAHLALRWLARITELRRMPGMLARTLGKDPNLVVVAGCGIHQVDPKQANGPDVNADADHNRCGHGSANT